MRSVILVPTKFEAELVQGNIKSAPYFMVSGVLWRTAKTIERLVQEQKVKKVVLLWFAGDLTRTHRVGEAYNICSVTNKKEELRLKTLKGLNLKNSTCITVTRPVYTKQRKENLKEHAELVEMECYYAAKKCKAYDIDFYSIRIISDNCDRGLSEYFNFKKVCPELRIVQERLAEISKSLVAILSPWWYL